MNKITNIILTVAGCLMFVAACVVVLDTQAKHMRAYAAEHNCRWDYNNLCYTEDQKPWLFK